MERTKRSALNEQIYTEAGEWFLAFRHGEPSAKTRRDFDLWVRRSPEHLAAYLEIAAIWNEAPSLQVPEKSELIAGALCEPDSIVELGQRAAASAGGARVPRHERFFARHGVKAAALLVLGIGAAAWGWWLDHGTYATATGELRTIALEDGSQVELNSRTKLKVRYSANERSIQLVAGQALFSVARDPARPFVVSTGNARVRAVGTRFDVYRKSAGTVVTVVEGRVAVDGERGPLAPSSATDSARPVLISAGQQLLVTPSEIRQPVLTNVANVTAWTQQQLAFDAASLVEVAEEFNRYNARQLVIRDSDSFDFRISGVFSSADPAALVRFLRDRPGIRVVESPAQIVVERIEGTQIINKSYQN